MPSYEKSSRGNWRRQLRPVACFAMLGCMRWTAAPPNSGLSAPAALRLHLRDGGSVIVRNAVVRSDSIVGFAWGGGQDRIAVARSQVERFDIGETSEGKTFALVFGLIVVVLGGLLWVASHLYDNELT